MKKNIKKIIITLCIIAYFYGGYFINQNNYSTIIELKRSQVDHPELLPQADFAKATAFWFANLRADIYWLEVIQYIWANAIRAEYKRYLYAMLNLITELNPFFEQPYLVGQLLLPNYNSRYEDFSEKEVHNFILQWQILGEKWISNVCDSDKVALIEWQADLIEVWGNPLYQNPCKSPDIPFGQWFLVYHYLKDPFLSSQYYKLASANEDALEWAKTMAAVMNSKAWDRERSMMMFLTIATQNTRNKLCQLTWNDLQWVSYTIFQEWLPITWELIEEIQNITHKQFPFVPEWERNSLKDECGHYINKATRELNLAYIEQANKLYFEANWKSAPDAQTLFDEGYIDFLPTDYQQYDTYGIAYIFNEETGSFDYKMIDYKENTN